MSHPAEVHVTLIGNVASGPEFAICGNGAPRAAFRLAVPERRFDREAAAWITSRVGYYSVICWRTLAEHVGSSLGRGDPIIVTGRQRIVEGSTVEVDAVTVGHDLRYGLSSFRTVVRRRGSSDIGQPPADDPFTVPAPLPAAPAARPPAPLPAAPVPRRPDARDPRPTARSISERSAVSGLALVASPQLGLVAPPRPGPTASSGPRLVAARSPQRAADPAPALEPAPESAPARPAASGRALSAD